MSPEESWLAIAKMAPLSRSHGERGAYPRKDADAIAPHDYHGISCSPNMPILRTPDHVGAVLLGFTLL